MMPVRHLDIAVIGDKDLIAGLRLAGISKYHIISNDQNVPEQVREAFQRLTEDPEIGIIVISEGFAQYVNDLITEVKEGKKLTPVIIEVPSKYGTTYGDVRMYYRALIKKFIGFEVEI